ncbi:tellurite resistance TerB family protein [Aureimonas flava]|uniref:Tellurite resistance TerB family protein n=1 Tax=Aureimonas flava TaxID=2320271 RepID=A0A3A1WJ32_9HYPH|nr:tellurite resistance TerB family protein [Aureimonas flava]RIY01013.1 tellurite resistance TerB family protein [Aureimonas flava]
MVDAQKLLDQFLGTGRGYETGARPGQPGAGGGSMQDTLARTLGGALGGTGARSGGGIGDLIGGVLSGSRGGSAGSFGGGIAGKAIGGAIAGGLATKLLGGKRGRKLGGSALKLGGLALVAGLGYKAWANYQAQQQAAGGAAPAQADAARVPPGEIPRVAGTRFHPEDDTEAERRARLLLSAMIAAAKADGYIDRAEEEAIFGRIDDLDLDAEDKGLLMDEMRRPLSIDQIVAEAGDRETAIEVYTASVLVVDADHPAERAYLDLLAARLDLPPELVAEIRRATDDAQA